MDFLIVYERKSRELENALLIKLELERRGYSCDVRQYYEAWGFSFFNKKAPRVIIVPHLYETKSIYRNFSRFGRAPFLVNLQYEQVLSEKWERLGHHNPKGEATKGIHVCWGEKTGARLVSAGVPEENVKVIGAIQLDLLRKEYRNGKDIIRNELFNKFALDPSKRWNLFLSSFTYADITDDRLKMNESVAGTNLSSFVGLHTRSRDEILGWLEDVLVKDADSYIIYRPHPDELSLEKVRLLESKHPNFKIINDRSAKIWIESADNVYSWYSTTVVESHFLDKPYSILRPFDLPGDFDSVLLRHADFITSYNDFESDYFRCDADRVFPINESYISLYYAFDKKGPSFIKLCDLLEGLYKSDSFQNYHLELFGRVSAFSKVLAVFCVYTLYKVLGGVVRKPWFRRVDNYLVRWFVEIDNQVVGCDEKREIEKSLSCILSLSK